MSSSSPSRAVRMVMTVSTMGTMLSRRDAGPQDLDSGPLRLFCWRGLASESAHSRRNFCAIAIQFAASIWAGVFESMKPRSIWARLGLSVAAAAAIVCGASARADVLHASYRVSLVGLPIGDANLNAELSPTSYTILADAKR